MSNLFKKASIITTPTAYEDGKLLSVKPNKTFGSELVTNGTFDTDSDWIKGTGWTIANGKASFDGGSDSAIQQDGVSVSGKKYSVSIEVLDRTTGSLQLRFGSSASVDATITENGVYNYTLIADGTRVYLRSVSGFDGSIDNVSVKEVIDADFDFTRGSSATRVNEQGLVQDVQLLSGELVQNGDFEQIGSELVTNGGFDTDSDWTKGTGWSIGSGVASCDGTQTGNTNLQQNDVFTVGNLYKITFDLTRTAGNFRLLVGSSGSSSYYTTDGSFTLYATAVGNAHLYIQGDSNFIGTVDNVTVKEVQGNVGTMTNQASSDLVYSSVLPDQSFLTGVNSAYNFIDLDTTDEYIDTGDSIGDSLGNNYTGTLTVAMWIKYDPSVITGSGNGGIFYMGLFNGTYGEVNINAISGNRITFHINEWGSKYRLYLTDTSTDWKHIAFVIDPNVAGNNKVYLNGVDQELTSGDSPTFPLDLDFTSRNTIIGAYYDTSYTFGGSIGQTALWTKSLTDAEILAIYNLGRHDNLLDSYSDNLKG